MRRALLLIAGAALLVLLVWRLGPFEILRVLRQLGWGFVPVLALGIANHVVRAVALGLCIVPRHRLRYSHLLAIRLSGESVQSLTFTGPVLSQPATAWLLERGGLSLRESLAATLAEYLAFAFVTAIISIAGLVYFVAHFSPPRAMAAFALFVAGGCAAFLAVSAVAIARRFYLIGTLIDWLAKRGLLRGRLQPDVAWINRMEDVLLVVLHDSPARFAAILAVEFLAQLLLVAELFVLLRALHIAVPPALPVVIDAVVKGTDVAFLFVPMQMGISEGAYVLVFGALGLSSAAGLSVALVRRARGLLVAAIGLAALGMLTRRAK